MLYGQHLNRTVEADSDIFRYWFGGTDQQCHIALVGAIAAST